MSKVVLSGVLIAAAVVVATSRAHVSAPQVVTVTITDQAVRSSPNSVPLGVVTFQVANRGKRSHSFRIAGKATPPLAAGHRAILRVDFARAGQYAYSASGVATFTLNTLIVLRPATAPPGTLQGPGATMSTPTSSQPCSGPSTTTVIVTMTDTMGPNAYKFSPSSIPFGTVTFHLINAGQDQHGLAIAVPAGTQTSTSATLEASQTASFTVTLAVTGSYRWWDSAGEGVETTFGTIAVH